MSLSTHSKFYYGFEVSDDELNIDFSEGSGELTAVLSIGNYTMTDFATELARALNDAGALTYTVSVNRTTRIFTIAASGTFSLLVATGSHLGTTAFGVAGFSGSDRTSAATYAGNAAAGFSYSTQFILQSYVGPDDYQEALYATVNQSASGAVEVVTFGLLRFVEMNLKYATNIDHGASDVIRTNVAGHENLQALMVFLTTKAPLEFMASEDAPATFLSVFLESTADDAKGLKFKLKEQYGQGLPGYFETGTLKFRVIE